MANIDLSHPNKSSGTSIGSLSTACDSWDSNDLVYCSMSGQELGANILAVPREYIEKYTIYMRNNLYKDAKRSRFCFKCPFNADYYRDHLLYVIRWFETQDIFKSSEKMPVVEFAGRGGSGTEVVKFLDPTPPNIKRLMEIWNFADYLEIPKMRNHVMDKIRDSLAENKTVILDRKSYKEEAEHALRDDSLKKLWRDAERERNKVESDGTLETPGSNELNLPEARKYSVQKEKSRGWRETLRGVGSSMACHR